MRFVSGPCSETQPASASSDNDGRGKDARALMDARGRYPVRRAAVPTRATGERREHERPLDEWPARTGTECSLRSLRAGRHEDRAIILRPWTPPESRQNPTAP